PKPGSNGVPVGDGLVLCEFCTSDPKRIRLCQRSPICDCAVTEAYVKSPFCTKSSGIPKNRMALGLPYFVSARRIVPLRSVPWPTAALNRPANVPLLYSL